MPETSLLIRERERRERERRTIFGHPIGLANLCGVEMWERFSFFGMLLILPYYLYYSVARGGLALPEATATGMVGAYGGFLGLSAVLGGWLADRLLGMERTVFYGGLAVMFGHLALAVLPGLAGVGVGLVFVALGSGALKANTSSLLGTLYGRGDPRCDSGFTMFYLGMNLGALIGPLVTGVLQKSWGFHAGFGVAAFGMALGLTQYVMFRRNLGEHGKAAPNPLSRRAAPTLVAIGVGIAALLVVVLFGGLFSLAELKWVALGVIGLASLMYFVVLFTSPAVTGTERSGVLAFLPLFAANAVFWSLLGQLFTTLTVYSDQRINWNIFGWNAPPSWVGSAEPIWYILLSPLFAAMWTKLRQRAPSTPVKFGLGLISIGAGFLLFLPMAQGSGRTTPALVVFFILMVFAIAELLLAPIGMSVTAKLAPRLFRAQMMALYYLSVGTGTTISGVLAKYYAPDHEFVYFGINGAATIVIGLLMLALAPWIRRHMRDAH